MWQDKFDDGRPVLLVVDDDKTNRDVIHINMHRDFNIVMSEDGPSCLAMVNALEVDIILLDLMMPGMSGYAVLEALNGLDGSQPPVIVLSAKDQTSAVKKAFDLGASDYVTKPFRKVELVARINAQVALRRGAQALVAHRIREALLVKEKEAAENADKAKSEFLANMSHEIRTPMNAIIGLSQLALKTELTHKQKDYLSKIRKSSLNLLRILNDILDFSKVEAGSLSIEEIPFSLDAIVEDTANIIETISAEKGISVFFDHLPFGRALIGDPLRISQVLMNLCNNAIKFTDNNGTVVIKLAVNTFLDKTFLYIVVQDTGIGMTEDQVSRLFQPFSQADGSTTRRYGGTGLGLAICKRVLDLMGGSITATSNMGTGSTFSVRIPILEGDLCKNPWSTSRVQGTSVAVVGPPSYSHFVDMLQSLLFNAVLIAESDFVKDFNSTFAILFVDTTSFDFISKYDTLGVEIIVINIVSDQVDLKHTEVYRLITKPFRPKNVVAAAEKALGFPVGSTGMQEGQPDFGQKKTLSGLRVLLVDDNTINQQVAREMLEDVGTTVWTAYNGLDALRQLRLRTYDIVLMDIQMPKMDGYEATAAIREIESLKNLPIVAMTAHAMQSDKDRCIAAGMNGHITKPIEQKDVLSAIARAMPSLDQCLSTNQKEAFIPKELFRLQRVDVTSGISRVNGKIDVYLSLLRTFYADINNKMLDIQDYKSTDKGMLRESAHYIKGAAATVSADSIKDVASSLEQELIKDGQNVESLLENLVNEIDKVFDDNFKALVVETNTETVGFTVDASNSDQTLTILLEVQTMIAQGEGDALEFFEGSKHSLRDDRVQADIEKLTQLIDGFEFDKASALISLLIERLRS